MGGVYSDPPRGVCSGVPAEIEFGAFQSQILMSGGNNFNNFLEKQLVLL